MLAHKKYRKTGKGLLGLIDKHIHATVAVIISTAVITTLCCVGNFMEHDNFCFASESEELTVINMELQDKIDIPITNEKRDEVIESITENKQEKVAVKTTKQEKQVTYYDIPLSKDIQDYVKKLCEKYKNVEETLVYAVIKQESNFNVNALGDNGRSKGLMQIQQIWHGERMDKLNVSSLMTAKGNIKVGIDILSEKIKKYDGNLGKALTAYNAGDSGAYKYYFSKGVYANNYAKSVLEYKDNFKTL